MDGTWLLRHALSQARRVVAAAAVLLLLVLGVSGALIARAQAQQREALAARFDTRLSTAASFIEAYIGEVFERERTLSKRVFTGRVNSDEFIRVTGDQGFSAAVLLDGNGRLLASLPANPAQLGTDMTAKYAHLRSAVAGTAAVSAVVPSAVGAAPVIGFAVPFDTPDGGRVFSGAYAVANTPFSVFLPNATPFRSGQNLIVDAAGTIVASSTANEAGRPLSQVSPPLAAIKTATKPTATYLGEGADRQYVSQGQVAGTTWRMLFAVDTDDLFAPLDTSSRWIPWLMLTAFGMSALGALAGLYPFLTQRARLVESEARRATILNTAGDAFISMDQGARITEWNTAATALLGWSAGEAIGQDLADLIIPEEQRQAHRDGLARFMGTGHRSLPATPIHVQARHRDGTDRDVEFTLSRMRWEHGWQFHAFLRDISERLEHVAQLRSIALTDPLTGLANRRAALTRLDQAMARAQRRDSPVAVLYIDVDDFKTVNDTHGHAAGDAVLIGVSQRLHATFRTEDTLARLGGDEFLVICEDLANPDAARVLAERLRTALARPYLVGDQVLHATASVGLALSQPTSTAESLLHEADQHMYLAKATRETFAAITTPATVPLP